MISLNKRNIYHYTSIKNMHSFFIINKIWKKGHHFRLRENRGIKRECVYIR
jgi:hypothetical protein